MYETYNVDAILWTFKHKAAIGRVSSLWTLLDSMIITSRMAVVRAYRLLLFPNVLLVETHQSYHLTNSAIVNKSGTSDTDDTSTDISNKSEDFTLPAQVRASLFFMVISWSSFVRIPGNASTRYISRHP